MRGLRSSRAALAAMLLLSIVAYARCLPGWFLSDDLMLSAVIPDGRTVDWRHVLRCFVDDWRAIPQAPTLYYRPLVIFTQALDATIYGLRPWGFHLTNVVFHGLNGWLVARIASRLGATELVAWFAGASFILLPLNLESVAWISGRTDLLCTVFALAAVDMHLRLRQQDPNASLPALGAFFALALMAKEAAIAVPLVLGVLDVIRPRYAPLRRADLLRSWVVVAAIVAAYAGLRARLFGDVFGKQPWMFVFYSGDRTAAGIARDFANNLELFFFPFNSELVGSRVVALTFAGAVVIATLAVAALTALRSAIDWRGPLAAWLCYFAALAPFAARVGIQPNLANARLSYGAFTWLCIGVVLLAGGGDWRRRFAPLPVAALSGLIGYEAVALWIDQRSWIDAGAAIKRVRDLYARTFGAFAGELVEDLPAVDRGAYLGLFNAVAFGRPFIMVPPNTEARARFRMRWDPVTRTAIVEEKPAWRALEHVERASEVGVWIWDATGAPLDTAKLDNCVHDGPDPHDFIADLQPPLLMFKGRSDIAPSDTPTLPETAYLLIRPQPKIPPRMFWIDGDRQNFGAPRMATFDLELAAVGDRVEPRQKDGFVVYAARLDRNRYWRGIHTIRLVRLDPTITPGPFTIGWFNIGRAPD